MRLLIIGRKESHAARRFTEEGVRAGHEVVVAGMEALRFEVSRSGRRVMLGGIDILSRFDVVFPLHLGPHFSETLLLSEWAASRGVRVIESSLAEGRFVSSKTYDAWKLEEKGLPVPRMMQCMGMQDAVKAVESFGAPIVVKGVHGAKGRWVFLANSLTEIESHLKGAQSGAFVFQEYLPIESEYRVMVVGGRALGAVSRNPLHGDFRRNYSLGAALEPAPLTPRLSMLAETASRTLGYAFAGVDIAISGGKPYILEVNRRPGFEGFESVTDVNVAHAFIAYVASDRNRRPAERGEVHALHGHHEKTG